MMFTSIILLRMWAIFRSTLFMILMIDSLSCSLIFSSTNTDLPITSSQTKSNFSAKNTSKSTLSWERYLLNIGKKNKMPPNYTIWGLLSSGGFHGGGNGNIFIFLSNNKPYNGKLLQAPSLFSINRTPRLLLKLTTIKNNDLKNFSDLINNLPKDSYHNLGADFYKYDLVKFIISEDQVKKINVLSMDDPHIGVGSEEHQKVLKFFHQLKKATNK